MNRYEKTSTKKGLTLFVGLVLVAGGVTLINDNGLFLPIVAHAQDKAAKKPPLSLPGTAELTLNGKKITVNYSRPSIRGRKIMGGLVPYGKVWRTGANAATSFVTEADLNVGGLRVPKGSYTLYTLPSEGTWKLIINKQTGQRGTEYSEAEDLGRVDLKKETISRPVEQFTISLEKTGNNTAVTKLAWENTRLSVDITQK